MRALTFVIPSSGIRSISIVHVTTSNVPIVGSMAVQGFIFFIYVEKTAEVGMIQTQ